MGAQPTGDIGLPYSRFIDTARGTSRTVMQDALSKANRYRQEANRCYELAKRTSPGFLRDTYRKVAVQYLFMAEDELKVAEQKDAQKREAVADEAHPSTGAAENLS
jgi:hypothetical protein